MSGKLITNQETTLSDLFSSILPKTKDHLSLSGSGAYKIIGNAVPCMLAYNIAKNVESKWERWFGEQL